MEQLPLFESAMAELPPRYAKSKILQTIYATFDRAVRPMIAEKCQTLEECDDFSTMPEELLNAYCGYFNVDLALDESTRRAMCSWRMTTIGGYYKLSELLEALGFTEYRIKKNEDGSLTALLQSRRNAEGTALQATDADADEFCKVFAEYGPAHLLIGTAIQRAVTFGSTDLSFGDRILFGMEDDD
jgi:hypothetical protein